MDNVIGKVVLARRDENLGAGNRIAAVTFRFGLGADEAQIGTALRFGQVHRPAPFARNHLGRKLFLLRLRSLGQDRRHGAVG